ncbi:MAG: ABC transporter ATP-binding protein, partial [Proteobacteria bacterium]|nr:ABC transporter ATP-binding protein [Pseudomonadota bacterium]
RARKRREAEQRQRLAPLRAAIERAEAALAALGAELAAVEARLGEPELHVPGRRAELLELLERQGALRRRVGEAEESWLAASETLETAQREAGA